MATNFELPSNPKELVKALDQEIKRAEIERNLQKAGWKIVDSYLAGARHFNIVDPLAGTMEIAFDNWDGSLQLRYEQLLQDFAIEVGRLMKMAVDPVGSRSGESLDALRKGAIGHAFLAAQVAPLNLESVKSEFIKTVVKYGTAGLEHWETDDPSFPDAVSVIHPRELMGLPAWSDGMSSRRALCRKRSVPLEWARDRLKTLKKTLPSNVAELRATPVQWGSGIPGESSNLPYGTQGDMPTSAPFQTDSKYNQGAKSLSDTGKPNEQGRLYVPWEEVYVEGDQPGTVCRMILKIGDYIALDNYYEEKGTRTMSPITVARYTDTGRFYGRGYIGPQIPFHDAIEKMLASFFQNVIDLDVYGTTLLPDTWSVDTETFKKGKRPRFQTYSPDISAPNHQQIQISPQTTGTLPAKAAEIGTGITRALSGHGPMFQGQAIGRMDSTSGYGFMYDVANLNLAMCSHSIADAFVGLYGRLIQVAKRRYDRDDQVQLPIIDEAMAGVVVGQNGQLELTNNPIPDPWEFKIDVKDRTPRDMLSRKQELKEILQFQLITPTQFWLTAYDEKLDIPGSPKDLIESYRKAVWQVVMLFQDGKEPGVITASEVAMNPEVQLMVVQRFMNKIEFSLADQKVREAFEQWKTVLEQSMGQGFPQGLMPPEQAAQMQKEGAFGPSKAGGLGGEMMGGGMGSMMGGM